ncbi:MAG TPA: hypothetical protein VM934_16580 [Pyrinomonadaceae bacterium]|jgi:chromosome segregation ATPase|nr:hypothetical protein [Pyrinomonadaceae bacterium]
MTGDELERTIQFILDQQARNEEKWVRNAEQQARNAEQQARNEEKWARTEEGIRSLLSIAEIHEREITAVNESVRTVDERQRKSDERQRHLDERLNALINTVERYISEGRNGKS